MSQVAGLGHVIFYRHPGRYPTLFHWSCRNGKTADAELRVVTRFDTLIEEDLVCGSFVFVLQVDLPNNSKIHFVKSAVLR
jgi:hypothetical protein